jgi:hemerythrin superfamily protein
MDAISVLKEDHRLVENLFSLLQAESALEKRKDIAIRLIACLSRHDAAEVQLLYPALRRVGGISDDQVGEALEDHREARDKLSDLDSRLDEVMTQDFLERWADLEAEITAHVKEEEEVLFPALQSGLTKKELDELGKSLETAKSAAPSHPHALTPDNPTAATILGTAMGMADRVRDAVSGQTEPRRTK